MRVKWTGRIFLALGFIFQYIIPVVLFGGVIPYTHDGIAAGLTKMGYIAIAVIALILTHKLKEWLLGREKSLTRGLLLSVFPIVWWLIIFLALGWVEGFVVSLAAYWKRILLFIVLGRLFYTVSEAIYDADANGKSKKEEDK